MLFTLIACLIASGSAFVRPPALASCTARRCHPSLRPSLRPALPQTSRLNGSPTLCAAGTRLAPPDPPTPATIRKFALPALALWLSSPLLSLVDTSAVGLSAPTGTGAMQLAALGPATTFCDGASYLFAFLNVATTNLYASAIARDDGSPTGTHESECVVRCAAQVGLICGIGLTLLCGVAAVPVLRLYVGSAFASDPALLGPAVEYVTIRSLSFPAALLGGVLQASLLGAKDSITPLVAIAYSTAVNIAGDYVCVARMGMGLRGAAIATLAAQYVGTAALLGPARRVLVPTFGLGLVPGAVRRPVSRLLAGRAPADRGDGADAGAGTELRRQELAASRVSARTFLLFAAPVLTLILGKISAYGFMTHAAAALGAVPLAAHQITLSLFFFISPFLEVISQTAQTFLPQFSDAARPDGADAAEWRDASLALARRLLRLGVLVAAVMAAIGGAVPLLGAGLLTNDATVRAAVAPLAAPLAVGALLTAPVAVSEGVLLARRELRFLAAVYVASIALLPPALIAVKLAGGPVARVWGCFAAFQLFRAVCFFLRIEGGALLAKIEGARRKK